MEHTSIVPNCNIVLVPLESDLQIMILRNKFEQVFQNRIAFIFCDFSNTFCEFLVHKKSFPARYGICADDRVHGFKDFADIVRCASFITANFAAVASCDDIESVCRVYCSKTFEEFLVRCAEAVVSFVCRCPESISSTLAGYSVDLQDSIVARGFLKCNTIQ